MASESQKSVADTAKIVLLTGVIMAALAMLAFFVYRSSSYSIGPPTGEVQQMKASARGQHRMPSGPGNQVRRIHP